MFGRTLINGSSVAPDFRRVERERERTDDLFDRFNVAVMNGTVEQRKAKIPVFFF